MTCPIHHANQLPHSRTRAYTDLRRSKHTRKRDRERGTQQTFGVGRLEDFGQSIAQRLVLSVTGEVGGLGNYNGNQQECRDEIIRMCTGHTADNTNPAVAVPEGEVRFKGNTEGAAKLHAV